MKIIIPPKINVKQESLFHNGHVQKCCTLNPDLKKILLQFTIPLRPSALHIIIQTLRIYSLTESHRPYYNWVEDCENQKYNYIFSGICSPYTLFYPVVTFVVVIVQNFLAVTNITSMFIFSFGNL